MRCTWRSLYIQMTIPIHYVIIHWESLSWFYLQVYCSENITSSKPYNISVVRVVNLESHAVKIVT